MLRPSICFVAVCIFLVTGKTQAQELSNTVVYLREGNNYGTGFFVRAKNYYLVTAEHVANYLRPFSTAVVRGENGSAIKFNLADLTGTSMRVLTGKLTVTRTWLCLEFNLKVMRGRKFRHALSVLIGLPHSWVHRSEKDRLR